MIATAFIWAAMLLWMCFALLYLGAVAFAAWDVVKQLSK